MCLKVHILFDSAWSPDGIRRDFVKAAPRPLKATGEDLWSIKRPALERALVAAMTETARESMFVVGDSTFSGVAEENLGSVRGVVEDD